MVSFCCDHAVWQTAPQIAVAHNFSHFLPTGLWLNYHEARKVTGQVQVNCVFWFQDRLKELLASLLGLCCFQETGQEHKKGRSPHSEPQDTASPSPALEQWSSA